MVHGEDTFSKEILQIIPVVCFSCCCLNLSARIYALSRERQSSEPERAVFSPRLLDVHWLITIGL